MEIHNLIVQVMTEHGVEPLLEEVRKKAVEQDAAQESDPEADT